MAGVRHKANGEGVRVISPTITEDVYKMVKRMAVEYESSMSATVRVAMMLGLDRMSKELQRRESDLDNKCEHIGAMLAKDGRKK